MTPRQFFLLCIVISIATTVFHSIPKNDDDSRSTVHPMDSVTLIDLKKYVDSTKTTEDNDSLISWLKAKPQPSLKESSEWSATIKSSNELDDLNKKLWFAVAIGLCLLIPAIAIYAYLKMMRG